MRSSDWRRFEVSLCENLEPRQMLTTALPHTALPAFDIAVNGSAVYMAGAAGGFSSFGINGEVTLTTFNPDTARAVAIPSPFFTGRDYELSDYSPPLDIFAYVERNWFNDIATAINGDIYASGRFATAKDGTVLRGAVAKFDGNTWSLLGSPMSGGSNYHGQPLSPASGLSLDANGNPCVSISTSGYWSYQYGGSLWVPTNPARFRYKDGAWSKLYNITTTNTLGEVFDKSGAFYPVTATSALGSWANVSAYKQFGEQVYIAATPLGNGATASVYRYEWTAKKWIDLIPTRTQSVELPSANQWSEFGIMAYFDLYRPDKPFSQGASSLTKVGSLPAPDPSHPPSWTSNGEGTPLKDGTVLFANGGVSASLLRGAYLWNPSTGVFKPCGPSDDKTGPIATGTLSVGYPPSQSNLRTLDFTTPHDQDLLGILVIESADASSGDQPQKGLEYSKSTDVKIGTSIITYGARVSPESLISVPVTLARTAHSYVYDIFAYDFCGNYTKLYSTNPLAAAQPVVMVVPTFWGSLPRFTLNNHDNALQQAIDFVNHPGYSPAKLYPEQINKSYNLLLETLDGVPGYRLSENLIYASYDWRLPIAPRGAQDGVISLSQVNVADDTYAYAAEYMVYWLEKAKAGYRAQYGDLEGFTVHLVAHGTGGLVARAFLQSDVYRDQYAGTVSQVIDVGVPQTGFVDSFYFRDRTVLDLIDNAEARGDDDSQQTLELLRQAVTDTDVADSLVKTWVQGIGDYFPTFDFVKRGPDGFPPAASEYDNAFLKDLNHASNRFTQIVGGPVTNIYSKGVSTPYQMYYSFGTSEEKSNLDGDGMMTTQSAGAPGFGTLEPLGDTKPFDQRDLVNEPYMLDRIKTLSSVAPIGIGSSTVAMGRYDATDSNGFTFSVVYLHVDDLDISSFDDADIQVKAPNGSILPAKISRITDPTVFGPIRTVYYRVDLPQGWKPELQGLFEFSLKANEVLTYKGVPVGGGVIGTLRLSSGASRPASEEFLGIFAGAATGGLVNGDWIVSELKSKVSNVAASDAYWGAQNHWFQDKKGDVWSLWQGGDVHKSTTLAGQHRWVLTNLTDAGGLSGSMHFAPGSLSGITTGWNAFNIQGIQDGKLLALWWSPEGSAGTYVDTDGSTKQGKGLGLRGNGWSLSSISVALTPINGAVATPPGPFRAYNSSQGNSRTDFDPRSTFATANTGMSVVLVDVSNRVYLASFNIWQQLYVDGARNDLNGQWLIEPLADVPSFKWFGLEAQEPAFEQQFIATANR